MPRIYFSNTSYPELREIRTRWGRHVTWWRAFGAAFRDGRFWRFVCVQLVVLAGGAWIGHRIIMHQVMRGSPEDLASLLAAWAVVVAPCGLLVVTWGGDLMRPHLRRVSPVARVACPSCGYQLVSQLALDAAQIQCPECSATTLRATFEPPYSIPSRDRSIRWPWS